MSCFHGITYSLGIMGCRAENIGMWEQDCLGVNVNKKREFTFQADLVLISAAIVDQFPNV